jgi:hypothetical protein
MEILRLLFNKDGLVADMGKVCRRRFTEQSSANQAKNPVYVTYLHGFFGSNWE